MAAIQKIFEEAINEAVFKAKKQFPNNTAAKKIRDRFKAYADNVLKRELEPHNLFQYELFDGHKMCTRELYL